MAVATLSAGAARAGVDEAVSYGVNKFGSSPRCGSSPSRLWRAKKQARMVAGVFDDWVDDGYWNRSTRLCNSDVTSGWFTDPSASRDPYIERDYHNTYGADGADVAFVSTHGGSHCSSSRHNVYFYMGSDADGERKIQTYQEGGGSDQDIELGDSSESGDAEIMLVDA